MKGLLIEVGNHHLNIRVPVMMTSDWSESGGDIGTSELGTQMNEL